MALNTATQIIPDVSFITAHVSYSKTELFSLPGADAPRVHVSALTLCCFHSLISIQAFRGAVTASVDGCTETKSAPSVT